MWAKIVEELRRAGPRKIALLALLAAVAILLAYGNNSTNNAASGRTLPVRALTAPPPRAPS